MSLDHYSTTAKNSDNENIYFEYTDNQYIQTVNGVMDGNSNGIETASKRVNGGTPTQRGIYRGMDVLQSTAKPDDDITRIPIMVLLTDGAAGSARSAYTTLSGGSFYEGDANTEDTKHSQLQVSCSSPTVTPGNDLMKRSNPHFGLIYRHPTI